MISKTTGLMKGFVLLLMLTLATPMLLQAQSELPMPKKLTRHVTDTLVLSYTNHLPIIKVRIKGKPYNFLIDTGTSICASFHPDINRELADLISMEVNPEQGNPVRMVTGKLDTLMVGRHRFRDVYFSARNSQSVRCSGIDGVIGYSILRELCVKFDVRKGVCILSDDNTIVKRENKSLKVSFETTYGGMPIFRVSPLPRIDQSVGLDTGSSEFYVLAERHYQAQKNIFSRALRDIAYGGNASLSLFGYDHQELRRKFFFPNFKVGDITVRDTEAQMIVDQNSYLGGALLELGILTLDYPNRNYYFQTYEKISAAPKIKDVTVVPSSKGLEIGVVWRMSTAYQKGIRASQRVIAINGESVKDPCEALSRVTRDDITSLVTMDDEGNRYEWVDEAAARLERRIERNN